MSAPDAVLTGLYLAHVHELRGFARRRVGRQEAEDVVQDTYLHLLQRGAAATLEHPRAYLFRIAANALCRKALAKTIKAHSEKTAELADLRSAGIYRLTRARVRR